MILIKEIIILLALINIFDKNIMFLYLNCAEIFKLVEKWGALGAILMARFWQSRASRGKRQERAEPKIKINVRSETIGVSYKPKIYLEKFIFVN